MRSTGRALGARMLEPPDVGRRRESEDEQVMLVVHLDIRPGAREDMRAALEELVEATRRCDRGVVRFEVGLDPDDDSRVVGYEIWASQGALDEHAAKEHTQRFLT